MCQSRNRYRKNLVPEKVPVSVSFNILGTVTHWREGRYQAGPKGRNLEVWARRAPRLLGYDAYSYWHTVPANFVSTLSDDPSNDIKPIPDLECQDI